MTERQGETLVEQLERELGVFAGTALGLEMLEHIDEFVKDEDDNWVDLMVWRLTSEGVPLPTTIQVLAARVALRRLDGPGALPTKVMTKFTERVAHPNAAFLQGALGIGSEEAYNITANAVGAEAGYAGKASTVSKGRAKYVKEGPEAHVLTEMGAAWAQANPEQLNALKEHLDRVPRRDPGTRRGK